MNGTQWFIDCEKEEEEEEDQSCTQFALPIVFYDTQYTGGVLNLTRFIELYGPNWRGLGWSTVLLTHIFYY